MLLNLPLRSTYDGSNFYQLRLFLEDDSDAHLCPTIALHELVAYIGSSTRHNFATPQPFSHHHLQPKRHVIWDAG